MTLAFLTGSPVDWGIIMVVALIVFGPKKMPEIGRQLGNAMREFRKIADEFSGAAHSVRDEVESAYKPVNDLRPTLVNDSRPTLESTNAPIQPVAKSHPYDQEDLMAPVVPAVPKVESPADDPVKAPLEAAAGASAQVADTKGH